MKEDLPSNIGRCPTVENTPLAGKACSCTPGWCCHHLDKPTASQRAAACMPPGWPAHCKRAEAVDTSSCKFQTHCCSKRGMPIWPSGSPHCSSAPEAQGAANREPPPAARNCRREVVLGRSRGSRTSTETGATTGTARAGPTCTQAEKHGQGRPVGFKAGRGHMSQPSEDRGSNLSIDRNRGSCKQAARGAQTWLWGQVSFTAALRRQRGVQTSSQDIED